MLQFFSFRSFRILKGLFFLFSSSLFNFRLFPLQWITKSNFESIDSMISLIFNSDCILNSIRDIWEGRKRRNRNINQWFMNVFVIIKILVKKVFIYFVWDRLFDSILKQRAFNKILFAKIFVENVLRNEMNQLLIKASLWTQNSNLNWIDWDIETSLSDSLVMILNIRFEKKKGKEGGRKKLS